MKLTKRRFPQMETHNQRLPNLDHLRSPTRTVTSPRRVPALIWPPFPPLQAKVHQIWRQSSSSSSDVGKQIGTNIFVHVTFILCTIVQVVLLERIFFRYRAERHAMLHPGEILPDVFNRGEQISIRLALAPWNRPPLPTVSPLRLLAILTSEMPMGRNRRRRTIALPSHLPQPMVTPGTVR
ncbi:hypothetical protein BDM02DRAFT_1695437 [Thelephora ganbajun]|uniref:Uncharacterized protein n=1 Tax=Thelephora ganbajun TaxID=370292 RepID=A0ACB6ZJD9_THEGA|nr:hypothetical protein BDM02DRAFT_1695437 [Thelephora ganbajun]